MLALRHSDGSEHVLVLTDLITRRTYGIDEAELSEPVRKWLQETISRNPRAERRAASAEDR
jgi:hypothetical protein